MSRRLAGWVTLLDESGSARQFPPDTAEADLPEWARGRITNPGVWGEDPDESARPGRGGRRAPKADTTE